MLCFLFVFVLFQAYTPWGTCFIVSSDRLEKCLTGIVRPSSLKGIISKHVALPASTEAARPGWLLRDGDRVIIIIIMDISMAHDP